MFSGKKRRIRLMGIYESRLQVALVSLDVEKIKFLGVFGNNANQETCWKRLNIHEPLSGGIRRKTCFLDSHALGEGEHVLVCGNLKPR